VLLKIKDENGNIERSFAVIVQVRSITNSLKKTRLMHDLYGSLGFRFFFGGGVITTIFYLLLAGTYEDCEKPRSP
jgi:hypothetical protein